MRAGILKSVGSIGANALVVLLFTIAPTPSVVAVGGPHLVELPPPTGPYAVGQTVFYWTDSSRLETLTENPGDHRELRVLLWYPAQAEAGQPLAPYSRDLAILTGLLERSQISLLGRVQGHSIERAPIARTPTHFPFLIFSHGNQSNSWLYTALHEELASNGYVVVAVDHPYDALAVPLSDGHIAAFAERAWSQARASSSKDEMDFYRSRVKVRVSDILFVLTKMDELDEGRYGKQFNGRLDLGRVGVFGHSIGGVAAAEACHVESRLKACLNLDGVILGGPFFSGEGPEQPFMFILREKPAPSHEELAAMKLTQKQWEESHQSLLARQEALLTAVGSGSFRVVIKNASHESFSDESFLLEASAGGDTAAERNTVEIVRALVVAFLDQCMKGKTRRVLESVAKKYPDVEMARFSHENR